MLKIFLCAGLLLFAFILLEPVKSYAGALPCDSQFCNTEEDCTSLTDCFIGGGLSLENCSWCGDFCADSCPTEGPVAVVPTMGQWGMIFAGIILGCIGIIALVRDRKINQYFD